MPPHRPALPAFPHLCAGVFTDVAGLRSWVDDTLKQLTAAKWRAEGEQWTGDSGLAAVPRCHASLQLPCSFPVLRPPPCQAAVSGSGSGRFVGFNGKAAYARAKPGQQRQEVRRRGKGVPHSACASPASPTCMHAACLSASCHQMYAVTSNLTVAPSWLPPDAPADTVLFSLSIACRLQHSDVEDIAAHADAAFCCPCLPIRACSRCCCWAQSTQQRIGFAGSTSLALPFESPFPPAASGRAHLSLSPCKSPTHTPWPCLS